MLDTKKLTGRSVLALAAAALLTTACEVTNPGPVQDEFLNSEEAWPGIVAGAARSYNDALDWNAFEMGSIAREIHPSGSTGSYGISVREQLGWMSWDYRAWGAEQEARWVAEDGIRRVLYEPPHDDVPEDERVTVGDDILAELHMWAGFSNRMLGETYCAAVIDGSAPQSYTVFLERAVDHFTNALQYAEPGSDIEWASYAGRASVYVDLDQWPQAVADAAQITDDHWSFVTEYYAEFGDDLWNAVHWSTAGQSYRTHSVWNTVYAQAGDGQEWSSTVGSYYAWEPNDPRVSYRYQDLVGDAAIGCCGTVPWWPQTKYDDPGADIEIASGEEMRLIEAENLLRGGAANIPAAIAILNQLRTDAGLATQWDPAIGLDSAWAALKRERGIELWLEGRRLADLRRWDRTNTPGALDPLETVNEGAPDPWHPSHLRQQDLCHPIPEGEEQTNPNVCAEPDGTIIPCGG